MRAVKQTQISRLSRHPLKKAMEPTLLLQLLSSFIRMLGIFFSIGSRHFLEEPPEKLAVAALSLVCRDISRIAYAATDSAGAAAWGGVGFFRCWWQGPTMEGLRDHESRQANQ